MQFIITKQIAVEAETPEEAATKMSEGQTISLNISPRPQQQLQPVHVPGNPFNLKPAVATKPNG